MRAKKKQQPWLEIDDPAPVFRAVSALHADPTIRALRTGEPLTSRQRVELFLKAVHEGALGADEWLSVQLGVRAEVRDPETRPMSQEKRAFYRSVLANFLERGRVMTVLGEAVCQRLREGLVQIPIPSLSDGVLKIDHVVVGVDEDCGLDYALLLLVDSKEPSFARDLCICRLASCGKPWLAERTKGGGRYRREYCCEEHYEAVRDGGAADRVRRHRAAQQLVSEGWKRDEALKVVKAIAIEHPKAKSSELAHMAQRRART